MSFHVLRNCFWLLIPILLWNILLAEKLPAPFLPQTFQKGIPGFISLPENILRVLLFGLTLLIPFSIKTKTQRFGLLLYILGTVIYFGSWLLLIYNPENYQNVLLFMAPAYTPFIWLTGIALICEHFFFPFKHARITFLLITVGFLVAHNSHAWLIYTRIA
jgi:hypothetical protein